MKRVIVYYLNHIERNKVFGYYIINTMSFTTVHYIVLFAIVFVLGTVRVIIEQKENSAQQATEINLIQKYLMTSSQIEKSVLPILWVHIPTEINSRQWTSYSSRNSRQLNQPYLYTTVKSIIAKCDKSFTICIINDDTFAKLLPNWKLDTSLAPSPMASYLRELGMIKLLYRYGGLICPASFLCFKNLRELYDTCTKNGTAMFAGEIVNYSNMDTPFRRSLSFSGAPANHERVKSLLSYIEGEISTDMTSETAFNGGYDKWLNTGKYNLEHIVEVPGMMIGTRTVLGQSVTVDHLMNQQYLNLDPNAVGLLIPSDEILSRKKHAWFSQLSETEAMQSSTVLGKYLLISAGECVEPITTTSTPDIVTDAKWVPFWKIPIDAPVWN
jgi:hypothetical protein